MKLIISQFADINIFHFFSVEINAIWKEIHLNPNDYSIYLMNYKDDGVNRWRYDFISKLVHKVFIDTNININKYTYTEHINLKCTDWMYDSWQFINYQPAKYYISIADLVKTNMNISIEKKGTDIVFVIRTSSRVLYDYETNTLLENVLLKYIPELKIVDFDKLNFEEQVKTISNASIMISCHGAANTNAIFLPPNGKLIEISFRNHWYCDPVCNDHATGKIKYTEKCCGKLTFRPFYHKADYHNICKIFNKDYAEIPLSNAEGFINENPINVRKIWVDSQKIIEQLSS